MHKYKTAVVIYKVSFSNIRHSSQNRIKRYNIAVLLLYAPASQNQSIEKKKKRGRTFIYANNQINYEFIKRYENLFCPIGEYNFLINNSLLKFNERFMIIMSHIRISIFFIVEG
jgi:hypothetical protein